MILSKEESLRIYRGEHPDYELIKLEVVDSSFSSEDLELVILNYVTGAYFASLCARRYSEYPWEHKTEVNWAPVEAVPMIVMKYKYNFEDAR